MDKFMVHGKKERKRRRIRITRCDYNLTIMKSPKPATERGSKGVGVTIESYRTLMLITSK
jgi:hypothetical protein